MKDLYGGLEGVGRFFQSWYLPSLLAVGLGAALLFPSWRTHGFLTDVGTMSLGEGVGSVALISLFVSLILATLSEALYRCLEGYSLPRYLKSRGIARNQRRREGLQNRVESSSEPLDVASRREDLDVYPRLKAWVMPTEFGNILRAGESYGNTQYGIDVVLLWSSLESVAPTQIAESLDRARTIMNYYVGVFWLSPAFVLASVLTAVIVQSPIHLLGILGLVACPVSYAGAKRAGRMYSAGLRALADTCRHSLAKQLGLSVPRSLEDERALWRAVSNFVGWGDGWSESDAWIKVIDSARTNDGGNTVDCDG